MKKTITLLALLLAFVCMRTSAQDRTITGKVTSSQDNLGIPGVAVVVVGTTTGTTTDIDGNYSLTVPATGKQIRFSGVGLKSKTVDLSPASAYDIVLEQDVLKLDEVVVTALGIAREKKALGYSVQDVNGDDITKGGNTNAMSSLSGKVAGLNITNASGQPGAATNIRIRGATSIFGSNQPLIIVDNVPIANDQNSTQNLIDNFGPINGDVNSNRAFDLNPDDIENISVLKGPAATALYGIQAANGVILITTKKGGKAAPGKAINVTYNTSLQWDKVSQLPELQTRFTQGSKGQYTAFATRSWGSLADTMVWDYDINDAVVPGEVDNYDPNGVWLVSKNDPSYTKTRPFTPYENEESFFRTGLTWTNAVSLSGGTDVSSFRAGISNTAQKGIIPLSGLNKSTFSLSGETALSTKTRVSGGASYTDSRQDGDLSGNNTSAITYGIYRTPINFDNRNGIKDSYTDPKMYTATNGHQRAYTYYFEDPSGFYAPVFDNPYWTINKNPFTSHVSHIIGNTGITYTPLSWLNIIYRIGLDAYSERQKTVYNLGSASVPEGQVIEAQYFSRNINSDLIFNAKANISSHLHSDYSIGTNFFTSRYEYLIVQGDGLNFANFYNQSNAANVYPRQRTVNKRNQSVYALANFDWKSMVYLGLTARNEWTSTLAEDKNHFFYPSANVGFVFTEAFGISDNKILPYGKIRASYAIAGKDADPQQLVNVYTKPTVQDGWSTGIGFPFNGNGGYLLSTTLYTSDLKPEKSSSYEIGADLRFLNNRIGVDFTYYYNKTTDAIVPGLPIAPSSGWPYATLNAGSMENRGIELILNLAVLKKKDFAWDMQINYAANKSKVLELGTGIKDILIGGFDGASIHAVVGQPYGMIYGGHYVRDGNGNIVIDDQDSIGGSPNAQYGFPLAATSDSIIGDPNPDWIGGIRNTFTYKNFSLSVLFDGKFGFDMHDGTRGALVTYGRAIETDDRATHDFHWEGVGGHYDADGNLVTSGTNNVHINGSTLVDGTTPAYQYWWSGNGGAFGKINEIFVEKDLHYIKLREIVLAYTIDKKFIKRTPFAGINVSLFARNLALWTDYTGSDPDQSLAGASNIQGLEWFNLPNSKTYGASIGFQF